MGRAKKHRRSFGCQSKRGESGDAAQSRSARGYRFKQAEAKSQARQAIRTKARKLTALMRCKIEAKLRQERCSPEQISGWLSEQGIKLSHQRIYQMIWDDKRDGGNLWRSLRRRGKRYNKSAGKNAGRGLIPNRIDIFERPAIVARKTRLGDWEGDTVVSAGHKGGLLTLVERKTQLAKITKLPRATARATQKAAVRRLKPIGDFVHTITFDNGKEFAAHQDIAHALKTKIFFATTYHAWERGLNENINGLIRDFFPKGPDLSTISSAEVAKVERLLNARPRKSLASVHRKRFSTPSLTLKFLCAGKLNPPWNYLCVRTKMRRPFMVQPAKWLVRVAIVVFVAGVAYLAWQGLRPPALPTGFASANGRIEATDIDIATKTPGRVKQILAYEGDVVTAGQMLVKMDTEVLEAQKREAEAQLKRATIGVDTARAQVVQRKAEREAAVAVVAQRHAELDAAEKRFNRSDQLAKSGSGSIEALDNDRARFEGAKAAVSAAEAHVAAGDSAISAAESLVVTAQAAVEAAKATIERIQADIDDSTLTSPRDGRIQFRVAQPGEVLGAGGRVLNLVDLGDVFMTFFLPTEQAARVALGSEVHLVFDAIPQYVVPARVTFVADVAQFTPKTVETAEERQKLMFRIKAKISPDLLKQYIRMVKTGVPGVAYVQLDPSAPWPTNLQVKLPQ